MKIIKIVAVMGLIALVLPSDFIASQLDGPWIDQPVESPSGQNASAINFLRTGARYMVNFCDHQELACEVAGTAVHHTHLLAVDATGALHVWLKENLKETR